MWKYVSRRFKDSVERTYNVIDARRTTWTCDGAKKHLHKEDNQLQACELSEHKWSGSSSSSSSGEEDFGKKFGKKNQFQNQFFGALTWSSLIVCGYFSSQLLCLHRRGTLANGWESRCRFSKAFLSPGRALHTSVLSHWVQTAPRRAQIEPTWNDQQNLNDFDAQKFTYEENSVSSNVSSQIPPTQINYQPKADAVQDAVINLLNVLGDIEFQLGVQSISADCYDMAVSHFKLATSHHHAGATFNLGVCYELGMGVEKNLKIALECYQVASSLGHQKAMYNIGVFYVHGLGGLQKNRKMAREYFVAAAKLGQADAKKALGIDDTKPTGPQHMLSKMDNNIFASIVAI